jgi:hypothetical protein
MFDRRCGLFFSACEKLYHARRVIRFALIETALPQGGNLFVFMSLVCIWHAIESSRAIMKEIATRNKSREAS